MDRPGQSTDDTGQSVRSLAFTPRGGRKALEDLGEGWINGVCIFKKLILAAVSAREN